MDTELLEVLRKGEAILERAHEVAQQTEERTYELMHDGPPPEPDGQGDVAPTDAVQRSPLRPTRRPTSH